MKCVFIETISPKEKPLYIRTKAKRKEEKLGSNLDGSCIDFFFLTSLSSCIPLPLRESVLYSAGLWSHPLLCDPIPVEM